MSAPIKSGTYELETRSYRRANLVAPVGFWLMNAEDQQSYGCGPGKLGDFFIPDVILGLDCWEPCAIHDFMYRAGITAEDKKISDQLFRQNLKAIIDGNSTWIMKGLRWSIANIYFFSVRDFGEEAFWSGKS